MKLRQWLSLATAVLIAALEVLVFAGASARANAASPAPCDLRLRVELTPDVPDPRDTGFLSSLLSNHPAYRLTLQRQDPGSVIELDLTGPGPAYNCRQVLETIRRDARVLAADAADTPAADEDTPTVAIVGAAPDEPPGTHLSRAGLGSLYWAARHPAQAWKVLLPIQEGSVAYTDVRAQCALATSAPSDLTECP